MARPKCPMPGHILACVVLIGAGCLAYSNTLTAPPQFDDVVYLTREGPYSLENRPTVAVSIAFNQWLGESVVSFHVWNLVVHLLAGLTLFGIVRRTLRLAGGHDDLEQRPTRLAFAVALLWTVHPLLTSAVTYIIQRCESMMGLCFLFCVYALLRGSQSAFPWKWYGPGIVVGFLGAGCKETMAVAPVVLLFYDRTFLASSWREVFHRRGLVHLGFALVLVYAVWISLPYFRTDAVDASVGFSVPNVSPVQYLLTQAEVLVYYLRLSFWPDSLCVSYRDWPLATGLGEVLPAGLFIFLLLAATAWGLWQLTAWGFLGLWFFVILAPTSSFVPLLDVCFEYRMYLPLAAVVTLAVFTVDFLLCRYLTPPLRSIMGWSLGAAVVLVLITLTLERNQLYQSSAALWADTAVKRPNNSDAHLNWAHGLLAEGKTREAEEVLRHTLKLLGDRQDFRVYYLLGATLADRGELPEGLALLRRAHAAKPVDPRPLLILGFVEYSEGRTTEAISWLDKAIRNQPRKPHAYYVLAAILSDAYPDDPGQQENAQRLLEKGMALAPQEVQEYRKDAIRALQEPPANSFLARKSLMTAKIANFATGNRDSEMLFLLGLAHEHMHESVLARTAFTRALRFASPRNEQLLLLLREKLRLNPQ